MKRFALCMFLLNLNLMLSWSQNDSIFSSDDPYFDEMDAYFESTSFRIGLGAFIPAKASTQYFKIAPLIEINWNFPISIDKSFELAAQFVVPEQGEEFLYRNGLDTLKGHAIFLFNGLIKFKKDIRSTPNSILDVGLGIGVSTVSTNVKKPIIEIDENKSNYESMTTLLLAPELEYLFNLNERTQFSLSFSIQYSPYKLKAALDNDIGKWYYIPKIAYRF